MPKATYGASVAAMSVIAAGLALHIAAAQPVTGRDVVPTSQILVDSMLDLAQVTSSDIVVDLGSGDGRMVIAAAKRGATARGIEYNPGMIAIAKANAVREGVSDKVVFQQADIFASDFSNADVVTLFLLPEMYDRLRPILLNLKPGTRVVSNTFGMGAWRPDQVATVTEECDYYFCKALLWIVPAKIDGHWTMESGELLLNQTFQTFTGSLAKGEAAFPITGGLIKGEAITFTAGGIVYAGKVNGITIQGTTSTGDSWLARRGA